MQTELYNQYMRQALDEALKGYGKVSPNPLVGAVIVKDGRVIGKGAHLAFGQNHAEVNAINDCKESPVGSDIFVTLEPCDHYGKTPPCSLRIIEAGIRRVFVGTTDLNCLVNGKGIKRLQDAGIVVTTGILEKECREINRAFFHYCQTGKPLVTLKMATSLDGCLAAESGNSKWISSQSSRQFVHHLRAGMDAVMIGKKTAELDNPKLDARLVNGRPPYRIVLDSTLTLSPDLTIFNDELAEKTIIFTKETANSDKKELFEKKKVKVLEVQTNQDGRLDLVDIIAKLGELQFNSILVEGGSQLASALLKEQLADRIILFLAPLLLGNRDYGLNGLGINEVRNGIKLINSVVTNSDNDIVITADLRYNDN